MRKSDRRDTRISESRAQAARNRMSAHIIMLLLTMVIIITLGVFLLRGKQTGAQSAAPPAAQESVAHPEAKTEFEILQGRWLRPDGGYVVEIKEIDVQGKMAAAYFNPRPINVSRAEATLEGTTIKVFIELRDINYPGATYHLTYDPARDQLKGIYIQPALQQSFDVVFVRMK